MIDNFLGKWQLIPNRSVYEAGSPPKEAVYVFEKEGINQIKVNMRWTNHEHKNAEMEYSIIPDGSRHSLHGQEIGDEIRSTFVDNHTLVTQVYRDRKLKSIASRSVDPTGMMKVVQQISLPNGEIASNVQYYKK